MTNTHDFAGELPAVFIISKLTIRFEKLKNTNKQEDHLQTVTALNFCKHRCGHNTKLILTLNKKALKEAELVLITSSDCLETGKEGLFLENIFLVPYTDFKGKAVTH